MAQNTRTPEEEAAYQEYLDNVRHARDHFLPRKEEPILQSYEQCAKSERTSTEEEAYQAFLCNIRASWYDRFTDTTPEEKKAFAKQIAASTYVELQGATPEEVSRYQEERALHYVRLLLTTPLPGAKKTWFSKILERFPSRETDSVGEMVIFCVCVVVAIACCALALSGVLR